MQIPGKPGAIASMLISAHKKSPKRNLLKLGMWSQEQEAIVHMARELARLGAAAPLNAGFELYAHLRKWMGDMLEALIGRAELAPYATLLEKSEREYMPDYPPMSPVTTSFYWQWVMFDLPVSKQWETFGSILLDIGREFQMDAEFLRLIAVLSASRMGLHMHEGIKDGAVLLREMVTGVQRTCYSSSGYLGAAGELWLARVFRPPVPESPISACITTPYLIRHPGVEGWQDYLQRTLPKTKLADPSAAYARLMKRGIKPNLWAEYIIEGYSNHTGNVIFLFGLPDVPESLPCSPMNLRKRSY